MFGLAGKRVLIAEDEHLLAADLANYLRRLGAKILGPVPSLAMADHLAETADAAILDINLQGEFCFPAADRLLSRSVPFALMSGYDSVIIPARFAGVGYLPKPASWKSVLAFFVAQGSPHQTEVRHLLPKMRLAARLIVSDTEAADRLVERSLETAVRSIDQRPDDADVVLWLDAIMMEIVETTGRSLLN